MKDSCKICICLEFVGEGRDSLSSNFVKKILSFEFFAANPVVEDLFGSSSVFAFSAGDGVVEIVEMILFISNKVKRNCDAIQGRIISICCQCQW